MEVGANFFLQLVKQEKQFHMIPYKYQAISNLFSAEIDISECKKTKCNQACAPSLPMRFHDKSMFFTVLLTFNASTRACEKKNDVKACQTRVLLLRLLSHVQVVETIRTKGVDMGGHITSSLHWNPVKAPPHLERWLAHQTC